MIFIIGPENLGSSTYADTTATGLSELAFIIDSFGVTPQTRAEGQPIPDSTRLVVLSRPIRQLSFPLQARLWDYMQGGGHVLMTLDPENAYVGGLGNLNPRFDQSGLRTLFLSDYGLDVTTGFLVEPWISGSSLIDVPNSYSYALPSDVRNPITDPLSKYELPIYIWGARHIDIEPLGINSYALPLFYNTSGYGETDPGIFPRSRGNTIEIGEAPLEANLGIDMLGRIEPGALAVNIKTGSRLVILGDSEMLQNSYGLGGTALNPTYAGNRIFAERLIAWLLEVPVRDWAPLPQGYTWISIDGRFDDWTPIDPSFMSILQNVDNNENTVLFQAIRTFRDNIYAYFLFTNDSPFPDNLQISLQSANGTIVASADGITFTGENSETEVIEEARFAVNSSAELRIPLGYLRQGQEFIVDRLCTGAELSLCADVDFTFTRTNTQAPFDHTLIGHMTGIVFSDEGDTVNMRPLPSVDSGVIDFVPIGTKLAILGRDSTGRWAFVESAVYRGWIAALLLQINGDIDQLPIIEGT